MTFIQLTRGSCATADDILSYYEIESQHHLWDDFLKHRPIYNENNQDQWLWQYWREESRPSTQIEKKLRILFSKKLKAQKQLKKLIRNGIPPHLRGEVWYHCSGAYEKMISAQVPDAVDSTALTFEVLLTHIHELDDTQVGKSYCLSVRVLQAGGPEVLFEQLYDSFCTFLLIAA